MAITPDLIAASRYLAEGVAAMTAADIQELMVSASTALTELASVSQAVATVAAQARRCKPTSAEGTRRWDMHTELSNRQAELSSRVRMALMMLGQAAIQSPRKPLEK